MKRVGGIFDTVCDYRTLTWAAWRAARGKRSRTEIQGFLGNLDRELSTLSVELTSGSFRFGDYRTFSIRDPKTREIHAPPFRDRVVHHAMIAATGSVFERGALDQSFACRAGRGQHAALRQLSDRITRKGWFYKADVSKFYDTVRHELLREMLARRFRERRLLELFNRLLNSYERAPGLGLPIGALTSQYLGNFFLDPFDHWAKQTRKVRHYLRYMDDMLFLDDREQLEAVCREAPVVLEGFGLSIKNGGILSPCALGIPYLGFVIYPDRTRLNRQGRRRLRRRLKDLERSHEQGHTSEAQLQIRSEALFAHARFGDDLAWRNMVTRFSRLRETQEPDPCVAGRLLEQYSQEVPLRGPEQEQARQPEQEQRVSCVSGPRHEGTVPTDDASSCARPGGLDETTDKSPLSADILAEGPEKAAGGAPIQMEFPW